ncbi:hypothetical protein VTL71DRAFT_8196 [Oculimacula yallundae]|uniref:Uncharacterized protein n=1 Tax=Oculimacula yallundae TaxID=86028 RepID=A0ABR4CWV2_9HELO
MSIYLRSNLGQSPIPFSVRFRRTHLLAATHFATIYYPTHKFLLVDHSYVRTYRKDSAPRRRPFRDFSLALG